MWVAILEWLLGQVLAYLLNAIAKQVQSAEAQLALDEQRGQTNEANVKAYNEAKTRQDKINAALALINRGTP